jgi:hypothetical protein
MPTTCGGDLLNTQMNVDGSVTAGAGQVLAHSTRDVQVDLQITELLCKNKIDDVDVVATLSNSHQEVVGLDIAMVEVTGKDGFNPRDLCIYISQQCCDSRHKCEYHTS